MLSLKVKKITVWPLRAFFIIISFVVGEGVVEKISKGYVIGTGSTKHATKTLIYYTTIIKFAALDILLIL